MECIRPRLHLHTFQCWLEFDFVIFFLLANFTFCLFVFDIQPKSLMDFQCPDFWLPKIRMDGKKNITLIIFLLNFHSFSMKFSIIFFFGY